jgi:hypothetical protein
LRTEWERQNIGSLEQPNLTCRPKTYAEIGLKQPYE